MSTYFLVAMANWLWIGELLTIFKTGPPCINGDTIHPLKDNGKRRRRILDLQTIYPINCSVMQIIECSVLMLL